MLYQLFNSIERFHYHYTVFENFNFLSHFHKYFEVVYVINGEISITVNNQTHLLTENDMAIILPDQIHSFKTYNNSSVWIALFSSDLVNQFANDLKNKTGDTFKFPCPPHLYEYFSNTMYAAGIENLYELKAFLYKICSLYIENVSLSSKIEKIDFTSTHKIIEYVSTHFRESITLKDLASMFGYNQNYISRSFNKTTGMNFKKFLNEFRVEYAKSVLLETELNISDIAYDSGFESIRNFNRVFLISTGMTPCKFRNG